LINSLKIFSLYNIFLLWKNFSFHSYYCFLSQ
jgi:hypothetical protein